MYRPFDLILHGTKVDWSTAMENLDESLLVQRPHPLAGVCWSPGL